MSTTQEKIFWETIDLLNSLGVLPYLILIGSWAEYIYQDVRYYEGFRSNFRTMDLDFLIPNLRHPTKKVNLCDAMERQGFLAHQRSPDGLTKFSRGEGPLEVEFLARDMGVGQVEPYKAEGLGIKVEGLRHLEILIQPQNTIVLRARSYLIKIPIPPVYVIHKLVINQRRPEAKQEKDINAVENILSFIQNSEQEILKLKEIYGNLTRKEKAVVDATCKKHIIKLFN